MDNQFFIIEEGQDGTINRISDPDDTAKMNWVGRQDVWGQINSKNGLSCCTERSFTDKESFIERYSIRNESDTAIFINKGEVSISIALPDRYESAGKELERCCHTHLWCGEEASYICAFRMSGSDDYHKNLGMILRNGSLTGYGIRRNEEKKSNDRGTFLLYPEEGILPRNEEIVIELEWFWFKELAEFRHRFMSGKKGMSIQCKPYIRFSGETFFIQAEKWGEAGEAIIMRNGRPVDIDKRYDNETGILSVSAKCLSEMPIEETWDITLNGVKTKAKTLVLPKAIELLRNRCLFISGKQQFHKAGHSLDGAFLIYDNENESLYYSKEYDHNSARERVGMGCLLARYLQIENNSHIEQALQKYTSFVLRELFDEETGVVYNDVGRDNTWNRLYNYPWMADFFLERFYLYGKTEDLTRMYKIYLSYYMQGGADFYAIGIPMTEAVEVLESVSLLNEAYELRSRFIDHAKKIAGRGVDYPKSEVNYEQSIVAPAVTYLYQGYKLSGDAELLEEADRQMHILELFNGFAPDYHLNEVAIRHWDGYWFGKRRLLGDTFPHYWSALSGLAFYEKYMISGNGYYKEKAENSVRGVLSLFFGDGRASCAYLYPDEVNQKYGRYYDPWANDQDWGLYYYAKLFMQDETERK